MLLFKLGIHQIKVLSAGKVTKKTRKQVNATSNNNNNNNNNNNSNSFIPKIEHNNFFVKKITESD